MKGILIYKGKYGATQQYAEWIGDELQLPVFKNDSLRADEWNKNDFIVIGSSVYEGKLLLNGWLKRNIPDLLNKNIFLFIVCATPADQKEKVDQIVLQNVPAILRNQCTIFFLRGRVVIKDLSWLDGLMLKMAARFTKDPEEKKGMTQGFDAVKKENILPLVNAVKAVQSQPVTKEGVPDLSGSD